MQRASLTLGVLVGVLVLAGCGTTAPAPCQVQTGANGGHFVRLLRTTAAATGCDTDNPAQIGDQWIFDMYEDPNSSNPADFRVIGYSVNLGQPDPNSNVPPSPLYGQAAFATQDPAADNNCLLGNMTMDSGAAGKYQISNFTWLNSAYYLGTEFQADVIYTANGCTANYAAQGIDPPVTCESNADCDPFATPFGSGINPDYDQNCILGQAWTTQLTGDDTVGVCFFQKPYPSTGGYQAQ